MRLLRFKDINDNSTHLREILSKMDIVVLFNNLEHLTNVIDMDIEEDVERLPSLFLCYRDDNKALSLTKLDTERLCNEQLIQYLYEVNKDCLHDYQIEKIDFQSLKGYTIDEEDIRHLISLLIECNKLSFEWSNQEEVTFNGITFNKADVKNIFEQLTTTNYIKNKHGLYKESNIGESIYFDLSNIKIDGNYLENMLLNISIYLDKKLNYVYIATSFC